MNGKLKEFKKAYLPVLDSFEKFSEIIVKLNTDISKEQMEAEYHRMKKQLIFMNDEYQVNVDKDYKFGNIQVWHLSIKRNDKEAIHDWRDLQSIKNMIVGEEYEAVEIYPSENRLVDTANQYHLWAFVKLEGSDEIPKFPLGFIQRVVTDESIFNVKQRKF